VNVNIYDDAFGREQLEVFRRDVAESIEIDYETWKSRPWTEKLVERTAALFESIL
jgi:cardiolipin synthase